jgi:hypothetical protein
VKILLIKFIRLPAFKRRLVVAAVLALIKARLQLACVPVRRILRPVTARQTAMRPEIDAERIGWSIETVSSIVPGLGNCLVRAVAGRALLAQHGYASEIRIGVSKNSADSFRAHAWLESGNQIITGSDEHQDFAPMPLRTSAALRRRNHGRKGEADGH